MQESEIENLFTHHPPQGDQPMRYELIRATAKNFAQVIDKCCPDCSDKSAAIRKLREAMMTANAAIACGPHPDSIGLPTPQAYEKQHYVVQADKPQQCERRQF